jgi:hypothetical protein
MTTEQENQLLEANNFNPAELSDEERADILAGLQQEQGDLEPEPLPKYSKGDTLYFRSTIAALSVMVADADPKKNEVAPKTVRFVPFYEKFEGDTVKVGYLKTSNEVAIKKLLDDFHVTRISQDEYEKFTNVRYKSVKRAPF